MRRWGWLSALLILTLVVNVAQARPLLALTTSLNGYWNMDEASGTRADSLGVSTLSDNNTVGSTTGVLGNAALFTAANSEWLSVGDNSALSTGNIDFSVAFWLKFTSIGTVGIIGKGAAPINFEWEIWYNGSRINLDIYDLTGASLARATADNAGDLSTDTWYFITAWHDAGANSICISVDDGTPDCAATFGNAPADLLGDFHIGRFDSGSGYLDGAVDEVGFWKKVLTSQERTDLYNAGVGCTYDFSACDTSMFTPTPTATATSTPGPTATSTSTPIPTSTPTSTPTLVPTPTVTPTPYWWEVDQLPSGDQYITERRATYGELWIIRLQIAQIVFLVFVALFVLRRWK